VIFSDCVPALERDVIDTHHARNPQRRQRQPHQQAQRCGPRKFGGQDRRQPSIRPAGEPAGPTLMALE
jgi:hypothetical protein